MGALAGRLTCNATLERASIGSDSRQRGTSGQRPALAAPVPTLPGQRATRQGARPRVATVQERRGVYLNGLAWWLSNSITTEGLLLVELRTGKQRWPDLRRGAPVSDKTSTAGARARVAARSKSKALGGVGAYAQGQSLVSHSRRASHFSPPMQGSEVSSLKLQVHRDATEDALKRRAAHRLQYLLTNGSVDPHPRPRHLALTSRSLEGSLLCVWRPGSGWCHARLVPGAVPSRRSDQASARWPSIRDSGGRTVRGAVSPAACVRSSLDPAVSPVPSRRRFAIAAQFQQLMRLGDESGLRAAWGRGWDAGAWRSAWRPCLRVALRLGNVAS
ncbi:unnamed protein product [Lampetra fluviatilis]